MITQYRCIVLSFIAALVLISCGGVTNTQLTSVWKDENYAKGPIRSVMIVGIAEREDTRILYENTFVELFETYGVQAVSSAVVMPDMPELDKEAVKAKAEELGIENVLVTHLAATDDEDVYVAPAKAPSTDRFTTYYARMYDQIPSQDSLAEREFIYLENKLYDVGTEDLIWSGRSTSVDPYSLDELMQDLGKSVMGDLQKQGMLE